MRPALSIAARLKNEWAIKKESQRSRRRSRAEVKKEQWKSVQQIIKHAVARVPFYQERFRASGITYDRIEKPDDLQRIPILTKSEIRQNFPDRLIPEGLSVKPSMMDRTSGSTSESLLFVRPNDASRRSILGNIVLHSGVGTLEPTFALTTPRCTPQSCASGDRNLSTKYFSFFNKWEGLVGLPSSQSILDEEDGYFENIFSILNKKSIRAPIIVADPVYLSAFAWFLKRQKISPPPVKYIFTSYELLTGSLKDTISEVFGCDIFIQYGASEFLGIASECEFHSLHINAKNCFLEVIREGRPARVGEVGKAVLTDLTNKNMPLIRYEIGDLVETEESECPCGRKSDLLRAIHGRVEDAFRTDASSSPLVTPLLVDEIFRSLSGVCYYRLIQKNLDSYEISILSDGDRFDEPEFLARANRILGPGQKFHFKHVKTLKPEKSMKYRFAFSELGPLSI